MEYIRGYISPFFHQFSCVFSINTDDFTRIYLYFTFDNPLWTDYFCIMYCGSGFGLLHLLNKGVYSNMAIWPQEARPQVRERRKGRDVIVTSFNLSQNAVVCPEKCFHRRVHLLELWLQGINRMSHSYNSNPKKTSARERLSLEIIPDESIRSFLFRDGDCTSNKTNVQRRGLPIAVSNSMAVFLQKILHRPLKKWK